jgi:hypothetical protein
MFVAMGETILQAGVSSTLKTPPNEKLSYLQTCIISDLIFSVALLPMPFALP